MPSSSAAQDVTPLRTAARGWRTFIREAIPLAEAAGLELRGAEPQLTIRVLSLMSRGVAEVGTALEAFPSGQEVWTWDDTFTAVSLLRKAVASVMPHGQTRLPDPEQLLRQVDAAIEALQRVPGVGAKKRRPRYDRDHLWLAWQEAGMKTAAIRDKWNREYPEQKIGGGKSGYEVVKKGLRLARAERDSE
jgi:hypothetical protein